MKPDPRPGAGLFLCLRGGMKSTNRTSSRRWTRRTPPRLTGPTGNGATTRRNEPDDHEDTLRAVGGRGPGPYETAYDISTGYSLERPIVRP